MIGLSGSNRRLLGFAPHRGVTRGLCKKRLRPGRSAPRRNLRGRGVLGGDVEAPQRHSVDGHEVLGSFQAEARWVPVLRHLYNPTASAVRWRGKLRDLLSWIGALLREARA